MQRTIDSAVVRLLGRVFDRNSTIHWLAHDYWEATADDRTRGYLLVDISNTTMSLIMLVYALLVWVAIPAFMRNRKPYNLRRAIIAYDFAMVAVNLYFFIKTLQLSDGGREWFRWRDTHGDWSPRALRYISIAHLYYLSKLVDMLDTFFMAFRKRFSQISFLHVWHHTSLSYAGWLYVKYNPYTPSILIIPFINTVIHMIMYGYYGCAAIGPHMRRYLWWKKYITQIQLFQFTAVFAWYLAIVAARTNLPIGYIMCNVFNSAFLFGLFLHFYIQSYRAEAAAAAAAAATVAVPSKKSKKEID